MSEEEKIDLHKVVMKLVGSVTPVADSSIDRDRLENLKELCELTEKLVAEIDHVAYRFKNSQFGSMKAASDYANKALDSLGIVE